MCKGLGLPVLNHDGLFSSNPCQTSETEIKSLSPSASKSINFKFGPSDFSST